MPGFLQVNGNDVGTVQNHGSAAFRPIAGDVVLFPAAHPPPQLRSWYQRSDILLDVLTQAPAAARTVCPRRVRADSQPAVSATIVHIVLWG